MPRANALASLLLVVLAGCAGPPVPEQVPAPDSASEPATTPVLSAPVEWVSVDQVGVLVHRYNATISCAVPDVVRGDPGTVGGLLWHGSCDPDHVMDRPWATLVDTTDDGLNASRKSLVAFNLTWGQNQGQGGRFQLCIEGDKNVDCANEPSASQYANRSMGFMFNMFVKHNSLWESTGEHSAWIEFLPPPRYCGLEAPCWAKPTLAEDWWFHLEVVVVPGYMIV